MQKQAGPLTGFSDVEQNAGCGDPRWTRYHSIGDLPLAACGISMHHLLHLQILPEQKEKTQPVDNLKLCLFEFPSVQHMYVRKHNACVLVPYLPNNAPFFLPILGISAYSLQATLSLTSSGGEKV